MRYLFFLIIGQLDVDMCEFCTAELSLTLMLHSYQTSDDWLIIGYGKTTTAVIK